MGESDIVEQFHGVYLLSCENPDYKGRTYIGYTVDPVRRLKRHNAGEKFGGARRTSNKGPWSMIVIVHGFPNSRAALRFEWAWQHPDLSRQLRHVSKKKARDTVLAYRISLMSEMLQVSPWCRLPLIVRWLHQNYAEVHSNKINLPAHMSMTCRKIIVKKIGHEQKMKKIHDTENDDELTNENYGFNYNTICDICYKDLSSKEKVTCVRKNCKLIVHLVCLAKKFCIDKKILPIDGICPSCNTRVLWGDIVKKKMGYNVE